MNNLRNSGSFALLLAAFVGGMVFVYSCGGGGGGGGIGPGGQSASAAATNVGTPISSLPVTLNDPGLYYLTGNLSTSGGNDGIVVNANDVTIDLMGFVLSADNTGRGIRTPMGVTTLTNIEVRNGSLRDFLRGVELLGTGHRVIGVRIYSTADTAIMLGGRGTVRDCVADGSGSTALQLGAHTIVSGCMVTNSASRAMSISGASVVRGNLIADSGSEAVFLGGAGHVVAQNVITGALTAGGNGINATPGSVFTGNAIYGNEGTGLFLQDYSVVQGNAVYQNTTANLDTCATCTFADNAAP